MTLLTLGFLSFGLMMWAGLSLAYDRGLRKGSQGNYKSDPELLKEPVVDPYGVELGKLRTAENMREAAAHTCRVIAREAANKARIANEMASDQRLTEKQRTEAQMKQKAWLYTCEAAERCEREIRALGLR